MDREWRKIIDLHPVRLWHDDLMELASLLTEVRQGESSEVEFEYCHGDSRQTLKSVDELESYENDVPTDHFVANSMICDDGGNVVSGISISLCHNHANIHLHSTSEAWFEGKLVQLCRFFDKTKPWYSVINRVAPFVGGAVSVLTVIAIFYFLFSQRYFHLTAFGLLGGFITVVCNLASRQKVFPYVRIYASQRKAGGVDKEIALVVLSVLTLLATIVGSILIPVFGSGQ